MAAAPIGVSGVETGEFGVAEAASDAAVRVHAAPSLVSRRISVFSGSTAPIQVACRV